MARVFLSYSRLDQVFADATVAHLRNAGIEVWLDKDSILPGTGVDWAIKAGIHASDLLVVLVSDQALASRWVRKELSIATSYQLANEGVKVVPVILPGASADRLPVHLRRVQWIHASCDAAQVVREILRVLDEQPIRIFVAPPKGRYNADYYRRLIGTIHAATESVWMTGMGFKCSPSNPDGKRYADQMLNALGDRLAAHVPVFRIQTGAQVDPYWAKGLVDLLIRYPGSMRLWRLVEEQPLVGLTAIDPGSRDSCVAEIWLSGRRPGEPHRCYTAISTFVRHDPLLTQSLQARIQELASTRRAFEVPATRDAFQRLVGKRVDSPRARRRQPRT